MLQLVAASLSASVLGDVRDHSVVWTDLLPEPGWDTQQTPHQPTYHNSMPIGNGHVAVSVGFPPPHTHTRLVLFVLLSDL